MRRYALARSLRYLLFAVCLLVICGCTKTANLRHQIEKAAAPSEGVQQTRFAYIGDIHTNEGTFHVTTQRLILKNMLAPRGLPHRLLLFDINARLVASYKYPYDGAVPLWCEGSRIYLFGFGRFPGIEPDPRLAEFPTADGWITGNVLDFSAGPRAPVLTREKRYGSSGGIEDDPWSRDG